MSRRLDDLSEDFRPKAVEFLARLTEAGILVMIVDTLRTEAEHAANLAAGTSWIARSKHLDGRLRGLPQSGSDAMDVCPFDVWSLHGPDKLQWNAADPVWQAIGAVAKSLSRIRWGGDFKPPAKPDLGHIELLRV